MAIAKILSMIGCSEFIVEHEYKTWAWLPDSIAKGKDIRNFENFFRVHLPSVDPHSFDGAILFKGEIETFLPKFIGYPFILKYRDIDCLSCDKSLVIKISHHLTIDFVTWEKELFTKIEELAKQLNLDIVIGEA